MRNIILHHHIFKNAGSSFSAILDNNFGRAHAKVDAVEPWGVLDRDGVINYLLKNPEVRAISSHTSRLLPESIGDIRFHQMYFLRHPIDRVGSVYSFERRQPVGSPSMGSKIARTRGIKEYVTWRLAKGNGAVIRNFQVVFLAGRETDMRTAEATLEDFKVAIDRLSEFAHFGLVEYFEDSLSRFKKYYEHELAGKFDIQSSHQNKSPDRANKVEERLEILKRELGKQLYDELVEKNE